MNANTLALINMIVQALLIVALGYAGFLARRKQVNRHCTVMRIAMVVQLAAVLGIMLPSTVTLARAATPGNGYWIEMIIHHGLGLVALIIWIFANLVSLGIIKYARRLRPMMRVASGAWMLSFILGLHYYLVNWHGILDIL